MVRKLRSEEGSALVLVMFLVLLLTILGVAVLGSTIGGAERTETRENDVQSLHLAQKGLDEAAAYIDSQLDKLNDIDPDKLEAILKEFNQQNKAVGTELKMGRGEINKIQYEPDKREKEKEKEREKTLQSRKYYITITASAVIHGVTRTLEQEVVIDSYPDFLKYSLGTEQTLTINGSPVITGNIYAGKELRLNKTANYIFKGKEGNVDTLFPVIKAGNSSASLGGLSLGSGEVHVQSLGQILYTGDDGITRTVNADTSQTANRIREVLGIDQDKVKLKQKKNFVQVNVLESFFDKVAEAVASSDSDNTKASLRSAYSVGTLNHWLNTHLSNFPHADIPVKASATTEEEEEEAEAQYLIDLAAFHEAQQSMRTLTDSKVFVGSLSIDNAGYTELNFEDTAKRGYPENGIPPKWLVVTGNLSIENYSSVPLKVRGNILVTGDVHIKGNVNMDSTMYVLGRTTVVDAAIRGLNGKELVLISKGDAQVYRVDSFKDVGAVSPLDAFFYTDGQATLYGVGSAFLLNGGFFAKENLTINAVLGHVEADMAAGTLRFDPQEVALSPRFQVNYNQQVYDHQQSSLPRVQTLNVQYGPVQLVKN